MKLLLLLAFLPKLIAADVLCPNSKTTCPENKQCCEVDGKISCCDPVDVQGPPARRQQVFYGTELKSAPTFRNATFFANGTVMHYGNCGASTCRGTCCSNSWDGCCEYYNAVCCDATTCCPTASKCCPNGCCEYRTTCCENGCCDYGFDCCDNWCCKKGYKCGRKFMSCENKGVSISTDIVALVLLAASTFLSCRY